MTIGARLYRLENQVLFQCSTSKQFSHLSISFFFFQMSQVDKKLDGMTQMLQTVLQMQKLQLTSSSSPPSTHPDQTTTTLMIAHNNPSSNSANTAADSST